jgi:hypothetical protein
MKLILPIVALVLISSCAEHQYLTISGANINKTETHSFVSEGDTVTVLYHFRPEQGRLYIKLFNETGEPIVVDWWKSAIIVGGTVFSYYKSTGELSGRVDGTVSATGSGVGTAVSTNDLNGTVYLNESSQFIPARAEVGKEMAVFHLDTLQGLPEKDARKDTIRGSFGESIPYRRMAFAKDQSPLTFRSYLTFRIGKAGQEKEFSREHEFYVSEVWKIRYTPQELPTTITSRGDMVYLAP